MIFFLTSILILLVASRTFGSLFRKLGQPPVIGEIVGGLLLGPTVLGHFLPDLQQGFFPSSSQGLLAWNFIGQMGLFLLMFYSGMEIRSTFFRNEAKTSLFVTLSGTLLPFLFGVILFRLIDTQTFLGPAANKSAFLIVFAIGIAITSIPVISRILLDLDLMGTPLARIILSSAVIEDIVLYAILSSVLIWVGVQGAGGHSSAWTGLAPMGAFAVGIVTSRLGPKPKKVADSIKRFSFAFFIPLYFALVGLKLDLLQNFDTVFFILFLTVACVVKIGSVYLGSRLANETHLTSLNLGIAMNARGGPGLVLASVSLEAGIINQNFYAILVLLVMVTSLMAGVWLGRTVDRREIAVAPQTAAGEIS